MLTKLLSKTNLVKSKLSIPKNNYKTKSDLAKNPKFGLKNSKNNKIKTVQNKNTETLKIENSTKNLTENSNENNQNLAENKRQPWKISKGFGGISDFLDLRPKHLQGKIGDAWPKEFLENKSFDDLHKLWFVLVKERNRLQTDRWYRRNADIAYDDDKSERFHKVEKSLRRIKNVVKNRNFLYKIEQIRSVYGDEGVENLEMAKNRKNRKTKPKTVPRAYRRRFHELLHGARRILKSK